MNDQEIMESLLLTTKGVCDLYMHGTIESGTQNVRRVMDQGLEQSLCMQDELYQRMAANGWIAPEQAQQPQIDKVRQKFANA